MNLETDEEAEVPRPFMNLNEDDSESVDHGDSNFARCDSHGDRSSLLSQLK